MVDSSKTMTGAGRHSAPAAVFITADRVKTQDLCDQLSAICEIDVVEIDHDDYDLLLPKLIVTDVPLDEKQSVQRLKAILSTVKLASIPMLYLSRRRSRHEFAQAYALGASAVVLRDTDRNTLLSEAARLINVTKASSQETARGGIADVCRAISAMFDAARSGREVSRIDAVSGVDSMIDLVRKVEVRQWLDIVWSYDNLTFQHCLLVTGLATTFAARLGFCRTDQRLLSEAAILHDIGKSRIPRDILNKPEKLAADEMEVMRTHAEIGYDLLAKQGSFDTKLLDVVRHHHEMLDGSGYPDGLYAPDISDLVRLTTICDIYAALIERRPYKPALHPEQAVAILESMDGKLDRDLVNAFIRTVAYAM